MTGMCLCKEGYYVSSAGTVWLMLTRLKTPEAIARHLFFVPECVFSFG
jgi:hypothetical protein